MILLTTPVMNNEQRILELLAEVLHKVDALSGEMNGVKGEIGGLKDDVKNLKDDVRDLKDDVAGLKEDVKGLKKDVFKLNIISAENSRAILKLADNSDKRLTRLEKAVFK